MKNLANLPGAIASIPQGPSWDPTNPTLATLKEAINAGIDIEIGLEIPDTYNGASNPLIVAQNLNNTNNTAYGGAEGVILVRKYVEPTAQVFHMSSVNYTTSTVRSFLNGTYLNNCSDAIKSIISDISIPYNNTMVQSKFFLMSDREVCSNRSSVVEGEMWDYWKQKTRLSSPSSGYNNGRIMKASNGAAQRVWLRSQYQYSYVCLVALDGSVGSDTPGLSLGVLPACFIGKD